MRRELPELSRMAKTLISKEQFAHDYQRKIAFKGADLGIRTGIAKGRDY